MKQALLILALVSSFAHADETPFDKFPMNKNFTNKTTITIRAVDNVQATCEVESKKRGLGGFGYGVDACSFWDRATTQCTIIVPNKVDYWTLGHEMRHCLQGGFH
jgi:hypothetical protein